MELKRWAGVALSVALIGVGSAFAGGAAYEDGAAKFAKGDYAGAGRELVKVAPFEGEQGAKARYLLGRVHELSGERPEAVADYRAVLAWAGDKRSEFVERARFYCGAILAEDGKEEGLGMLKAFAGGPFGDVKTALGAEAVLRMGHFELEAKKYAEAVQTLKALTGDARFADQALWFMGRAQILAAQKSDGIASLKLAAEKARTPVRRLDILLELGDAQLALGALDDAAATYDAVARTRAALRSSGPLMSAWQVTAQTEERVQEGMARRTTALVLGGKYAEAEQLAQRFAKQWRGSVLAGGVMFREAESVYLQGCASGDEKTLQAAIAKLTRVVNDFPESEHVNAARFDWGTALYRLGKFADAAEVLRDIPGSERTGNLATASLLLGDSLLRTLPKEGEDALSAAKMLTQAERAAGEFSTFATANPNHPQTPEALYKLGYCYQRIAAVLSETGGERWKMWQQARSSYDGALGGAPADSALFADATFERANVIMMQGDYTGASGEFRKFLGAPLSKWPCTPLALLRLGTILRLQGKGAEGAGILGKWLAANTGGDEHTRLMMRYEQGLGLKEAGKTAEAQAIFEALVKDHPESDEGVRSLWRIAQADREAIAARLTEARRRTTAAKKAPDKEAAAKELASATEAMRGWVEKTAAQVAGMKQGGEGAVRLNYELAWGYRMLGEQEVATARSAAENGNVKVMASFGQQLITDNVPDWVPLQASEIAARDAYMAAIAAGENGDAPEREAANMARLDLGEMLAQRGLVDEAMDLFTEVLEQGLSGGVGYREAVRPRLRIAACLLAKGKPEAALAQVNLTVRPRGQVTAEGRYLGGEAYVLMDNWDKVMVTLRPFEDETYYGGEIGDRALMRLGESLLRDQRENEATYVFKMLLRKYPRSPLVKQAKLRLTICEADAAMTVKINREALKVRRRR
jgi:tetratricopeptide (TPR) repeat protein